MQTRHFALGIALLLLTGVVSAAQAKTLHVNCKGAATLADGVETNIDTDGDGASATLDQGLTNCNIGRFFFQNEAEFILQPTVTTACPAGTSSNYLSIRPRDKDVGFGQTRKPRISSFFKLPRRRSVSMKRTLLCRLPHRGKPRPLGVRGNTLAQLEQLSFILLGARYSSF
jgi:hypothetical protein